MGPRGGFERNGERERVGTGLTDQLDQLHRQCFKHRVVTLA